MVSFCLRNSLLIFFLDDLSIDDRGVLKSLTVIMWESICAFKSFSECLMKLGALTLGAYMLLIISFLYISSFISIKYPSLSHLINVNLKSIVSDISIATPSCFRGQLPW
jgi:hypothetical protein